MVDPAPEGTQPNPQSSCPDSEMARQLDDARSSCDWIDGNFQMKPRRSVMRHLNYVRNTIIDAIESERAGLLERTALAQRIQTLQAEIEQLKGRVIPGVSEEQIVAIVRAYEMIGRNADSFTPLYYSETAQDILRSLRHHGDVLSVVPETGGAT